MSQWPVETPEEVIERTRRDHGDAEAALVAKALGWEPAPRHKAVPARVGRKPKRPPGIGRPAPTGGPNLREIKQANRDQPVTLVKLLTIKRAAVCPGCKRRVPAGEEMGRLSDGKLACGPCIPMLAPGRHLP